MVKTTTIEHCIVKQLGEGRDVSGSGSAPTSASHSPPALASNPLSNITQCYTMLCDVARHTTSDLPLLLTHFLFVLYWHTT